MLSLLQESQQANRELTWNDGHANIVVVATDDDDDVGVGGVI